MRESVPDRFRGLFSVLGPHTRMDLDAVYADDVVFDDPLHHVEGLPALRAYFERMNANLREARFTFTDEVAADGAAMLAWTMHLDLARGPRRTVTVDGVSHLLFGERVTRQRDYFDVGAMVYEQIPLVGGFLRFVRRQLG